MSQVVFLFAVCVSPDGFTMLMGSWPNMEGYGRGQGDHGVRPPVGWIRSLGPTADVKL